MYNKVASMFCGMGGIDLAFQMAGFEIVWANEIDSAACRTYRNNFGNQNLVEKNIQEVDTTNIPDFDILMAGFPCQPFSIAGRQEGFSDKRGNLFFEIARIIDRKGPPVIFLENVPNLISHDKGKTFLVIYNTLASLGYTVQYKVMSANEYANLPQTRSRIFIVAFLDNVQCDYFSFPKPIKLKRSIEDIIQRTERKHASYYYNQSNPIYTQLLKIVTDKTAIYHIKDYGIIKVKNQMCPTLTANMGTWANRVPLVLDDFGIRKLTLRECLDFQGFTANFNFPNSISVNDAYKQIGNSVPVSLIERIARQIKCL